MKQRLSEFLTIKKDRDGHFLLEFTDVPNPKKPKHPKSAVTDRTRNKQDAHDVRISQKTMEAIVEYVLMSDGRTK